MLKYYDRACPHCGTETIDSFEPSDAPVILCDQCGEPTERLWRKSANVIGDEMDAVITNGSKTPWRCRFRGDYKNFLKQHGYRVHDTNSVPENLKTLGREQRRKFSSGSALSALPQSYMDGVAQMLARDKDTATTWRDPAQAPIGITSDEGVLRYLTDQRRAERGEYGFDR